MMRFPPPLVAVVAAVAQRALAGSAPRRSAGRTIGAAAVSLASLSLASASVSRFRRSGTTLEPLHPEQATFLVTTGANSISRNPMYVGLAGLLVANAIWRGSWFSLAPVAGFVAFIDRRQIAAEEAALQKMFGEEYEGYRSAVPRWLDRRSLTAAHP